MKILIAGRAATGKTALAEALKRTYGWTFARPKAVVPDGTDEVRLPRHAEAVTQEQADAMLPEDKIPFAPPSGPELFFDRTELAAADAAIVPPSAIAPVLAAMPKDWFRLVQVVPEDDAVRRQMAIGEAADGELAAAEFDARCERESAMFDAFESDLEAGRFDYANCDTCQQFANPYGQQALEDFALDLELARRFDRNVVPVIRRLMDTDVMRHDKDMTPVVSFKDGAEVHVPVGQLVEYLEKDDAMLGDMIRKWMLLDGVDLSAGRRGRNRP